MKPLFCNLCHKKIIPPAMLKNMKMQVGGKIKITCSDKKCKGFSLYKGN